MSRYVNVLIGAFLIAPSICLAARNASSTSLCSSGFDTIQKAADLFTAVQHDAQAAAHRASVLLTRTGAIDPHASSNVLLHIRAEVNCMNRQIDELQALRGSIAPWEQSAVERTAGLVQRMSVDSDHTLRSLEAGAPSYVNYVASLNSDASALVRLMRVDAHAARVDNRAAYLQPNLGMLEVFGK